MKRTMAVVMSLVMLLNVILISLPKLVEAADYQKVVLRGSLAPLDWGSDNNPLLKQEDGTWKSNLIALEGGKKLEFKYVRDNNWMDGSNLEFVPPQTGKYVFVYHPNEERNVDVRLVEEQGKVTFQVTLPKSTPDWITPTIGTSLNNFNYSLIKMKRVGDQTYTVTLTGEPATSFTYFYALGDEKFKEVRDEVRQAAFSEENHVVKDVVTNWKGIPVAQNVTHNFNYTPFIPSKKEAVTVTTTVDHFGPIDNGRIYYTVDGSTPFGKRGVVTKGQIVPMQVVSTKELADGLKRSVLTGVIPGQKNETRVKYKVDVWNSNVEGSQFADTNSQTPEGATEFAYYVDKYQTPDWAKDAVIYHVFVDRFMDGNSKNNEPVDPNLSYDERLKGWMGGDLAGIQQKLNYIKKLGVNTIWISPIYEGPYSHGYHPANFTKIDPRFGDEQLMKNIIKEAHKKGMKVVYDLVPNHTSSKHPFFQDALKNGVNSPYYQWYNFIEWPNKYETFYGIGELPQFNNDNPQARDYMLKTVVPYWLKELDFDGFRLDYAKGPSYSFWVDFRHAVKQMKPNAFIFGEVWDSREKINSYSGKLDGALDFSMQGALLNTFAKGQSMKLFSQTIRDNQAMFHPEYIMATFLDNHDMPRFLFESGGDVNKLMLAAAAQFTLPGAPVIYYGTEVGLSQSRDHNEVSEWKDRYWREMMPWDEENQDPELRDYYTKLIRLRNAEPVLRTGTYKELYVDDHTIVYERSNKDDQFIVIINKGTEKEIEVDKLMNGQTGIALQNALNTNKVIQPEDGKVYVTSKANSVQIFEVKKPKKNIRKKAA
ncbi:alpha-amylase family glycosyl hydrolase [Peribacillus deserti]|nr:alpha-amylase family glycosyl hydrolase [Peribacillus deserti]